MASPQGSRVSHLPLIYEIYCEVMMENLKGNNVAVSLNSDTQRSTTRPENTNSQNPESELNYFTENTTERFCEIVV